ncbi:MAG: N-acetylmuramoyl-L-alanine amidase [Oscillospiraceae bacterium]|nr:N-acetylmuramoyl-L-alanine amidase [Oscillospiraceae bacterium]
MRSDTPMEHTSTAGMGAQQQGLLPSAHPGQDSEKRSETVYRGQKIVVVLVAVGLLLCCLWTARLMQDLDIQPVFAVQQRPCLILDPGHGGIDGGAIAYNGVKESDLNLQIALKLRDLADLFGCDIVMTRSDDNSLSDRERYSEREDLELRVAQIESVPDGVLISIHQNFFPTSQASGAQVFYGPGEESRRLGILAQDLLIATLRPSDRRLASPAPKKLYITSHVSCPAILVECGFLSDLNDLQKLCNDSYQTSIATVLFSAFLQTTAPRTA